MKIRKNITCPVELVHDILKGKWKMVILYQIYTFKRVSLSDLQKSINNITQKMLLEQLNELREYNLVDKEIFEGYPLKVEYFLTERKGKKIIEALKIMQEIGLEYLEERNILYDDIDTNMSVEEMKKKIKESKK